MTSQAVIETELPDPPAAVWQALTEPAAIAEWLMPVDGFAPVVGQRFQFRAKPVPGWDGVVDCAVIEVDKPHVLAYTWQGSKMRSLTTVRWTLRPTESGGTALRLVHDGFSGMFGHVLKFMHRNGWRKMVTAKLPRVLAEA